MFCPNCGAEVGDKQFCGNCGFKMNIAAAKDETASATEANTLEASAPEANAPEANAPEASAPEASTSEASAPEASAPETSAPEANAPEASAPEASAPEASTSEASAPEASAPEANASETNAPEAVYAAPAGYANNTFANQQYPVQNGPDANAPAVPPKKGKGKIIAIAVIALVIVGVLAAAACHFFLNKGPSKSREAEYTFYLKENSAFYLDSSKDEPVLITDSVFKDYDDVDKTAFFTFDAFEFSKNEKKLFYPERVDAEKSTFTLYCKLMDKKDAEPIKLAENVICYTVSDDGETLIYLDSDDNLYKHNMTDREKILSDIDNFWIADDCLSLVYLAEDGGLYFQMLDGEKDKIDSDVDSVEEIADDLSSICYLKDGSLYLKKKDSEKVKIDSDVDSVEMVTDGGYVYYTKENDADGTGTLLDYIEDKEGQAKSDAAAYDKMQNLKTEADLELMIRHFARKTLEEREISFDSGSLYCYNGEKSDLVNSAYEDCCYASEKMMVYKSFDNVDVKKVKMSEIVSAVDKELGWREKFNAPYSYTFYGSSVKSCDFFDELEKIVKGAYETGASYYAVVDGKPVAVDDTALSTFAVNDDKNEIYYFSDVDEEKGTATLKLLTIKDGAVLSNETYDTDVSTSPTPYYYENAGITYYKDYKDDTGDLYLNKDRIEYDVSHYTVFSDGTVIYYTDYDSDKSIGTAFIYSGGEKTKISEDVHYVRSDSKGNVLYCKDYSSKNGTGDLYTFKNGESAKIDYDTYQLTISKSDTKYRYALTYSYVLGLYNNDKDEEEYVDDDDYYYDDDYDYDYDYDLDM